MAIENPFYPGYYPGDPIIKGPPGGGGMVGPLEFNLDVINEELDALEAMIPDVPEWTKKQIMEDLKYQLRAKFSVEEGLAGPQTLSRYETEEREDLPGAQGITLVLNPEKWKDPGKQLKTTLTGWGKAIFDYDDLDARVKKRMWRDLLTKDPTNPKTKWVAGAKETEENTRQKAREIAGGTIPGNPLKLTEIEGTNKALDGAANQTIKSVLEFQESFRSAFPREEKYDDVLENSLNMMKQDVILQLEDVTYDALGNQVNVITNPDAIRRGWSFVEKADFANVAGDVDKAANDVAKALDRSLMETATSKVKGDTPQIALDNAKKELEKQARGARQKIAQLKAPLSAGGRLADGEIVKLGGILDPFDKRLEEIQQLLQQGHGTTAVSQKLFLNKLSALRNSTVGHRGIKSGDLFTPGIRGQYLRSFEAILIGKEGGGGTEGRLLQEYFGRKGRGSIPKLRAIISRQYVDKERETFREIFANIGKEGEFSRMYLWPKIKNLLYGYTPAYYVENFLKRMSYFGFVTNDNIVDADPKGLLYKISNTLIKGSGLFQNKFRVGFEDGAGKFMSGIFRGGEHFGVVEDLKKLDPAILRNLLLLTTEADILAELTRLGIKDPQAYLAKFMAFKKWLADYIKKTKKDLIADSQGLKNLLISLSTYNDTPDLGGIGITTKYIGLLQRAGQFLNKLQSSLMNNVIGKIVGKLFSVKTMIVEALAAAISVAIPVLAPIERLVSAVLRVVLDGVEKLGKTLFKAVFQADMESLTVFLEEVAQSLLKFARLVAIAMAIPVVVITLLMMVIFTSIPQDNPGKAIGGGGDGSGLPREGVPSPIENPTACPLTGSVHTTTASYDDAGAGHAASGYYHGSDTYWLNVEKYNNRPRCSFAMPGYFSDYGVASPLKSSVDGQQSFCAGVGPAASFYGYAADFASGPYASVYAPELGGDGEWTIERDFYPTRDTIIISKPGYILTIAHMILANGLGAGDKIVNGGGLGKENNEAHIHVEMMVDSTVVKPELYLCQ